MDFHEAIRGLFVYLPRSLEIKPAVDMPASLVEASVFDRYRVNPGSAERVQRIDRVRIGTVQATLKTELVAFWRKRNELVQSYRDVPDTTLTVLVDGILVFEQKGLRLRSDGRPFRESRYEYEAPNLDLHGCHVTIDFDRETAPVLPARDALDPDELHVDDLPTEIYQQVATLLPELVDRVTRTTTTVRQRRALIISTLSHLVGRNAWREEFEYVGHSEYHESRLIAKSASALYAERCPIAVVTASKPTQYPLLSKLDASTATTVVVGNIDRGHGFSFYAKARGITRWIHVSNRLELALLRHVWPGELEVIGSNEDLFQDIEVLLPEVRPEQLVSVLRGDYALSDSALFGDALFCRIPAKRTVIRSRGLAVRRKHMKPSEIPRVVLNLKHPLIECIEVFLEGCDANQRRDMSRLLDAFCDGVVEDKTKLAPEARWRVLQGDLAQLLGTPLDYTFESLELSV